MPYSSSATAHIIHIASTEYTLGLAGHNARDYFFPTLLPRLVLRLHIPRSKNLTVRDVMQSAVDPFAVGVETHRHNNCRTC